MATRLLAQALFLLVLALAPATAQSPAGLPAATLDRIERAISAEMSQQSIPGLSAAVAADHRVVWSDGFGLADLENYVPAKSTTVYRLGSISKSITAVAVLQLAERGRLDLDAPIQRYCPSFPQKPWPITARQLLAHLGGIRHYQGPEEFNSTRHYTQISDTLEIFKNDPLLHEPGTRFSYTTYGYNLLGCAIEGASGMKYLDFVRENIFVPAGMDRMRADDVYEIIPNRAQGYRRTSTGRLLNSALADTSNKMPGGGLCSTVIDLVKFAIAVQTGKLVKKTTLEQMFSPQRTRDGQLAGINRNGQFIGYGLGWFISERGGRKEVWHTGGQQRVSTILYMQPGERFAVALMTNLEEARLIDLARRIADIVLQNAE